jgi:acyl-CoA synthetase (AMP-forming)/AMP-acid ligase II
MGNIQRSWRTVLGGEIDFVYVVPPLVRLLGALPPATDTHGTDRVLVFCAAAPVQQEELRTLERKFSVTVFNVYGLTELTFAVFFGCRDHDGLASDSIGYPIGIEARILTDEGAFIDGPGRGELHIRGPMLTDGYLRNPGSTSLVWDNGWLRTGDLAEREENGRYFIRGRLRDTVIRGGVLCYLNELEHYLRRAPGVIDACAFKGRDLPSGDELCAVVHVAQWVPPADLVRWVREHVGCDKIPDALFVWTSELPRNSNGKVLRHSLAEMHRTGRLATPGQ